MNEWCFAQNKERESWETMDQTQRQRYVSRLEPLALHPRLHHREGFLIHYLPPREPPPRRICYNSRSTELLSQTTTSQPRGKPTTNPPHTWGIQTKLHLSQEGANTNNPINLTKRDTNNKWGFTTSGMFQPQTTPLSSFPQNKILID